MYTKSNILKIAKKYQTKRKFKLGNRYAYDCFLYYCKIDDSFHDQVCSHMNIYKNIADSNRKRIGIGRSDTIEKVRVFFKQEKDPTVSKLGLTLHKFLENQAYGKITQTTKPLYQKECQKYLTLLENKEYREKHLVNDIIKDLKKIKAIKKIEKEVTLTKHSRIDLIIHTENSSIPVEVKHDISRWSEKQIHFQKLKYDNHFKRKKKYKKTIIVSKNGKYGISKKMLIELIKKEVI